MSNGSIYGRHNMFTTPDMHNNNDQPQDAYTVLRQAERTKAQPAQHAPDVPENAEHGFGVKGLG